MHRPSEGAGRAAPSQDLVPHSWPPKTRRHRFLLSAPKPGGLRLPEATQRAWKRKASHSRCAWACGSPRLSSRGPPLLHSPAPSRTAPLSEQGRSQALVRNAQTFYSTRPAHGTAPAHGPVGSPSGSGPLSSLSSCASRTARALGDLSERKPNMRNAGRRVHDAAVRNGARVTPPNSQRQPRPPVTARGPGSGSPARTGQAAPPPCPPRPAAPHTPLPRGFRSSRGRKVSAFPGTHGTAIVLLGKW